MISLTLGLMIIGGVTGIIISTSQSNRTNQALSEMQESARIAFELLSRDIRQAGGHPCGNDIQVVNILNSANEGQQTPWEFNWSRPLMGYGPSNTIPGVTNRSANTDAISLVGGDQSGIFVSNYSESNSGANFRVGWPANLNGHGFRPGEILFVCNQLQGTIFQMTGPSGQNAEANLIVANSGGSQKPGNCTKGFGPVIINQNGKCDTNGNRGPYSQNAIISSIRSNAWYIGDNGRLNEGGRSLYRVRLGTSSEDSVLISEEISAGVSDMKIEYRVGSSDQFLTAGSITQWNDVNAVKITLTVQSQMNNVSSDNGRLSQTFTQVVSLRNRTL